MSDTVALAFSGGLDTSYCVIELIRRGFRVETLYVDTGGVSAERAAWIERRALELGAAAHHVVSGAQALWDDFVTPFVMAGALYGGQYPLLCADRTIIAAELAQLSERIGAAAVAHGCTAMGNDQVRFDLALRALSDRPIMAPVRDLQGDVAAPREYEMHRLRDAGFETPRDERRYSINENLLGVTMSGSEIDRFEAPDDALTRRLVAPRPTWPQAPLEATLAFQSGALVAIDGRRLDGPGMLRELNERFGAYGVGRFVYTGDTVIGLKGRIVFEAPGLTALLCAHRALEEATLTKLQVRFKPTIASQWTELVYSGLFHDPLRTDLESFLRSSQRRVTGEVVVRTEGGACHAIAVRSPNTLVGLDAVYAQHAGWSALEAEGFIRLFGQSGAQWAHTGSERKVGVAEAVG